MINFFIWDNGEQVALRILEEIFTTLYILYLESRQYGIWEKECHYCQ